MLTAQNPIARSPQPQPEPTPPTPAALPPAPGWSQQDWDLLLPADQPYFSETPEEKAERVAVEWSDIVQYVSRNH